MSKKKQPEPLQGTEKEFLKIFESLCYNRSRWQVWEDIIGALACTIANSADQYRVHWESREKEYARCIKNLKDTNVVADLFAITVMAYEQNPRQDFLGKMYMNLELGSHYHGQFFTPNDVAELMAKISIDTDMAKAEIDRRGWISVNDPACGAGVTLIAAANVLHDKGINYQRRCLFTGNDIDRIAAMMCYIQLSLLGCPGWIAIANTISNPVCGPVLMPHEKPGQEIWYTPMYFTEDWQMRVLLHQMSALCGTGNANNQPVEKEHHFYCFDFDKEETWKRSDKRLLIS